MEYKEKILYFKFNIFKRPRKSPVANHRIYDFKILSKLNRIHITN